MFKHLIFLGFLNVNSMKNGGSTTGVPSNLGILDQIAAMHWIQENIEVSSCYIYNIEVSSCHIYNIEVSSFHIYNKEVSIFHIYNRRSVVVIFTI